MSETAPRDMSSFETWAYECGIQRAEGLVLTNDDGTMTDVYASTATDAPSGTCVLYVPEEWILTSAKAMAELRTSDMDQAEKVRGGTDEEEEEEEGENGGRGGTTQTALFLIRSCRVYSFIAIKFFCYSPPLYFGSFGFSENTHTIQTQGTVQHQRQFGTSPLLPHDQDFGGIREGRGITLVSVAQFVS